MRNRKLASIRKLYDINQTTLANSLGVTLSTYSAKETGRTAFSQKEMIAITNYFKEFDQNLTMDDIFFIDEVTEIVTNHKELN